MRNFNRALIVMAASAVAVMAQSDPPGRVGRLNLITGAVSMQPAGVDDWVEANLNRPLTTGDRIWVDQNGRAEMHIGGSTLRLNARTAFEFLNLDDNNVQIRLTEGTLSITLRRLDQNESFEVDTPNLAFSLLRPGEYRIDANPDSATTAITVRGGEGEVTAGDQAFTVHPRERAQVSGVDTVSYEVLAAPGPDGWDNWCSGRDRREEQSQAARHVSREMVGYQDLDDYGDWQPVAEYGDVWVPRGVAADWSPYHYGHWAWIEPWGWTWVDDAPWGFAPFHYGRWVYAGRWAWVPGPVAVRPVYAPALVAWIGFGGGSAGVAWFPLGPREVYVPAYRHSPTYLTRVNNSTTVINNINITNIRYVNQRAPGAVVAVPQSAFAGARSVQQVSVRVDARQIQQGQVVNKAQVAPQRESVLGHSAGGSGGVARPPASAMNRQVVAKTTPPPPPIPFARRQQALAADPGRPLDATAVQSLRSSQPATQRNWVRPSETVRNQSAPPERVRPANRNVDQPQRPQPDRQAQPGRVQQDGELQRQQQQRADQEKRAREAEQQRIQQNGDQQRLQQQRTDQERRAREADQQRIQQNGDQQRLQQQRADQERRAREAEQQRIQQNGDQQRLQQQRAEQEQRAREAQQQRQQQQQRAEQEQRAREAEQRRVQQERQPRTEPRQEQPQKKEPERAKQPEKEKTDKERRDEERKKPPQ